LQKSRKKFILLIVPKYRFITFIIILVALIIGFFDSAHILKPNSFFAKSFELGLDLRGGVHLVYEADVSAVESGDVSEAMSGLRDVIERRVNLFGVAEPLVQVEHAGVLKLGESSGERLIIELPGITDVNEAIKRIGETPLLEFKTETPAAPKSQPKLGEAGSPADSESEILFAPTELNGRYLKLARVDFDQTTFQPIISIEFNDEGTKIFGDLTKENIGKRIGIFLDGALLSAPVVRDVITSGSAQITGQFTPDEAKTLVRRLNSGALPLPIKLISQQAVGATLGERVLSRGVYAGVIGLILVAIFLVLWYRLPGLIAVLALVLYVGIILALFKLIPVTLTAAGIAGFILSIGMAVDANILIFERVKEERKAGKDLLAAITEGFHRAWLSIRDSNVSSLITALVLFWMGTSIIRGFALTLGIGVLVSMFSAITVSRSFLLALKLNSNSKLSRFLFGSGV